MASCKSQNPGCDDINSDRNSVVVLESKAWDGREDIKLAKLLASSDDANAVDGNLEKDARGNDDEDDGDGHNADLPANWSQRKKQLHIIVLTACDALV